MPDKMAGNVEASLPQRDKADSVGMALSLLCLIHCMAFPVLAAFAPAILANLPGDDSTHRTLLIGICFVGVLAFRSGYRVHRRVSILALFLTGMGLISLAAIMGQKLLSPLGETAITVCGSCLLVTAHWLNRSFCRSCAAAACAEKHFG